MVAPQRTSDLVPGTPLPASFPRSPSAAPRDFTQGDRRPPRPSQRREHVRLPPPARGRPPRRRARSSARGAPMSASHFCSWLGAAIAPHLALKKVLGRRFRPETVVLARLHRCLLAHWPGTPPPTPAPF